MTAMKRILCVTPSFLFATALFACGSPADGQATSTPDPDRCSSKDADYNETNVANCTARLASSLSGRDRAMTLNIRGNTYDALHKYDLAIADYTEVIRLLPDFEYGYANRALMHSRKGNYQAAIADYDQALRLNAMNTYARYGRGVARLRAGDAAGGNDDIKAALQSDPEIAAVYKQIGMVP
jgi:lipoprotein NlpI